MFLHTKAVCEIPLRHIFAKTSSSFSKLTFEHRPQTWPSASRKRQVPVWWEFFASWDFVYKWLNSCKIRFLGSVVGLLRFFIRKVVIELSQKVFSLNEHTWISLVDEDFNFNAWIPSDQAALNSTFVILQALPLKHGYCWQRLRVSFIELKGPFCNLDLC